ncbi:uncharacterized protein LOC113278729 [Papaver somniferum]|uniref:uncharacterized protein LOC113278729 n=1 Tax=Papaver somniferum TaxID=3469 RepID=UPI000E6F68D3|nr:uncharacterized protein LOC113278729 [Papaver somniferum]
MALLLYVDDIILTGSSKILLTDLIKYLSNNFAMKELGNLHYFLGLEAVRSENSIMLSENKYTMELLSKAHMLDCNPCSTPVSKGPRVSIKEGVLLPNATEYRTIVGMLQYLCLTRPDICFDVNYASKYMHSPTDIHLLLVKSILRYLQGTLGYGITLRKGDIECLTAFTDSDWGSCPETSRSTCGYAIFMGKYLISWSSKKHPTVSRSTAEAEYKSLSVATTELEVKHIKIHYHVVRELIEQGFLTVQHVSSENQLAYLFTKGLCAPIFTSLLQQLLVLPTSSDTSIHISAGSSTSSDISVVAATEDISNF